jgi:hypothetical protein
MELLEAVSTVVSSKFLSFFDRLCLVKDDHLFSPANGRFFIATPTKEGLTTPCTSSI